MNNILKRITVGGLALSVASAMTVGLSGCMKTEENNTIKWVMFGDLPKDLDLVLEKANEIIEPELGLKLEMEYIDSASFQEKIKMKMASNDPYDLVFTGYCNDYHTAVEMGGLYDITDIMNNISMKDGTTANMSDVVDDFFIDSAKVEGKIYGIPNTQVVSHPPCMAMEKPVADECGVDYEGMQKLALANTDEQSSKAYIDKITEELAKIKAKRPDISPLYPSNYAITNIYEELIGGVCIKRDGSDNKMYIKVDLPEYQYGVDALSKWYEAGYIKNDIASSNSIVTVPERKQYAIIGTSWKPGQDVYYKNEMGSEPAYSLCAEPYVGSGIPLQTMISVGANSRHPEEAVKLIYMINSNEELFNILVWGIEGKHYNIHEDGTAEEIKESGYNGIAALAWKYGNQFKSKVMTGQPADVWEQTEEMNTNARKSPAMGFVPNTENLATELANVTNVVSEYRAREQYGTAPRMEYWNEYRQKLSAAGIETIRDELQKQYDEFLKNK